MNIAANLTAVVERALPALSGSNVTYNKQHNIYLSDAYTSAMGNTYYQGIRLSNRIIISYSIGEGYLYTFLNDIRIYGFNGTDKKLIATKDLNCCIFQKAAQRACVSECWKTTLKARQNSSMPPLQKVISKLSPTSL